MKGKRKEYEAGVEAKRREMRLLVGKRYAGLIEVADGITDMKSQSESLTNSLAKLRLKANRLKTRPPGVAASNNGSVYRHHLDAAGRPAAASTPELLAFTAQLSFLVNVPPKLHQLIADQEFAQASLLYLLADRLARELKSKQVLGMQAQLLFPVLSRCSSTLPSFRPSLLSSSRLLLSSPSLSPSLALDSLLSLLLLRPSTVRQVFADFLLARSEAFNAAFLSSSSVSSLKSELLSGISILLDSLKLIYQLFAEHDDDDSSSFSLSFRLSSLSSSTTLSADLASLLPQSSPPPLPSPLPPSDELARLVSPLPTHQLTDRCLKWFESLTSSLDSRLSSQLGFVTSIKGLALIRDAAINLLNREQGGAPEPNNSVSWAKASEGVLGRKARIWEEAVEPALKRAFEGILKTKMAGVVETLVQGAGEAVDQSSSEQLIEFMWTEEETTATTMRTTTFGDGHDDNDAEGRSQDKSESSLAMKTLGRTKTIQRICGNFEAGFKEILKDAEHFSGKEEDASSSSFALILSSTTRDAFQSLFRFLDSRLKDDDDVGNNNNNNDDDNQLGPVVLARLISALPDLCPSPFWALNLTSSTGGDVFVAKQRHFRHPRSATSLMASSSASPSSVEVESELDRLRLLAWDRWVAKLADRARRDLGKQQQQQQAARSVQIRNEDGSSSRHSDPGEGEAAADSADAAVDVASSSSSSPLASALTVSRLAPWELVEIKDEDEDQATTESVASTSSSVSVPASASPGLHAILHGLTRQLSRAGGFAVPRGVVEKLIGGVVEGVVAVTEQNVTGKSTEAASANTVSASAETLSASAENASSSEPSRRYADASGIGEMNQTRALQMIFDLRYLQLLLAPTHSLSPLLLHLRSFVDPFDLALAEDPLQARILRHVSATRALYGLIAAPAGHGPSASSLSVVNPVVVKDAVVSTLVRVGGSAGAAGVSLGARFPTIPLASAKGTTSRRGGPPSPILRGGSRLPDDDPLRPKTTSATSLTSSLPKVPSWSAGLSKLTASSSREGSNSPSDFFKSGAALYNSWFGGGSGASGGEGN